MIIRHNMAAMSALRQSEMGSGNLQKNSAKIASGYKINSAADGVINCKRLLNQNKYKRATAYPTKTGFVKDIFAHKLTKTISITDVNVISAS